MQNSRSDGKTRARNTAARHEGKTFECMIISAAGYYSAAGIAEIAKNEEARQVIGRTGGRNSHMICVNAKKSLPDFAGTMKGGRSVFLEAKHTDKERIEYQRVSDHQREILQRHSELGAACYILVSFGFQSFYRFPIGVWVNMQKIYGRKYIAITDDIQGYEIKEKNGILMFLE